MLDFILLNSMCVNASLSNRLDWQMERLTTGHPVEFKKQVSWKEEKCNGEEQEFIRIQKHARSAVPVVKRIVLQNQLNQNTAKGIKKAK